MEGAGGADDSGGLPDTSTRWGLARTDRYMAGEGSGAIGQDRWVTRR